MSALLELEGVSVRFRAPGGGVLAAVDGVSCAVHEREMVGVVGESGSGKTTLGRAILGLVPLAAGTIHWRGRRIDDLGRRRFRPLRRELQLVYQDPAACLDPRMSIAESIAEPLESLCPGQSAAERARRVRERMEEVGLATGLGDRYPHQLSGGQLQRAVIARALVVDPRFVVCDEPVSALDVSVQGQIVNLLARIRSERGLASLFISHNLAVVAALCERVLVMFRGRLVESAGRAALIGAPLHPYTRALLDSMPRLDADARTRARAPATAELAPAAARGCAFAPRCPYAIAVCTEAAPPLVNRAAGHAVACHRADEWAGGLRPAAPA